jgi:hypothetical protein
MSSPDKEFYSDKTGQNNVFHIKELYFSEFKNLADSFKQTSYYFQKNHIISIFISKKKSYNDVIIFRR